MKIDLLSWLLFPQAGADQRWNQGGGANHKSRPGVIWASGCVHLIVLGGGHLYQVLQEVDRFTRFSEQAVVRCQWWRGWWERSGPDIEAGTNLSLALTHHILNQTVLHLLNVHVHGPGQFLEFDKPEYVMSLRENQPPGTKVGLVTLSGLSESQKFEFSLFPVRYWTKFSTKINYDISNTVSVTLITLKPLDQDKRISADPRWAKFDFVGIRVDVSAL